MLRPTVVGRSDLICEKQMLSKSGANSFFVIGTALCFGTLVLLTFATPDEAIGALAEVERRYDSHCRAARALAEQHFDSAKVLSRILGIAQQ